ncbi:MAG: DUF1569 domain-containing protein [Isosphaeraceae bacterium]
MTQRALNFSTYDEAIAEIERLERTPHQRLGNWSLGQACRHLSYFYRGSLDGFGFMLPWPIRRFMGKPLLRKILHGQPLPVGARTIPKSVPPPTVDEASEIAEAKASLARLRDATEPLHPSPLFGSLSPEEWRGMHLRHTAHHLGFLLPFDTENPG